MSDQSKLRLVKAEPADTEARLLTPDEVTKILHIGRTKVYELMDSGELESITIGRCRRIPHDAVLTFIARKREEAKREKAA